MMTKYISKEYNRMIIRRIHRFSSCIDSSRVDSCSLIILHIATELGYVSPVETTVIFLSKYCHSVCFAIVSKNEDIHKIITMPPADWYLGNVSYILTAGKPLHTIYRFTVPMVTTLGTGQC